MLTGHIMQPGDQPCREQVLDHVSSFKALAHPGSGTIGMALAAVNTQGKAVVVEPQRESR